MTAPTDAVWRVPNWDLRVGRGASRSRAVRRRYCPTAQAITPTASSSGKPLPGLPPTLRPPLLPFPRCCHSRERAAEARTGRSPAAQRRPQGVLDAAAREPIMPAAGKGRSHPLDLETKRCSIWSAVGPRQVMTQAVQIGLIWVLLGCGFDRRRLRRLDGGPGRAVAVLIAAGFARHADRFTDGELTALPRVPECRPAPLRLRTVPGCSPRQTLARLIRSPERGWRTSPARRIRRSQTAWQLAFCDQPHMLISGLRCGPFGHWIKTSRPRRSAATRALAEQRAGGQQAEGPGAGDGLGPGVRAELGIHVADVGPDGVVRDVQLAGDLRGR